jgi:hypothetical protein
MKEVNTMKKMSIYLKSGNVIAIEVNDDWKISSDISTGDLTLLHYPGSILEYIRVDDVSAVTVE